MRGLPSRDSSPRAARWPVPRALAVALSFLAFSAAFQAPGLSDDWLLSEAGALRNYPPWADEHHRGRGLGWRSDPDYVRYYAPYAAFIQRELRAGRLPLWNPYVATGVPVVESVQPALFFPVTLLLLVVPFEHALTVAAIVRVALAGAGTFGLVRVLGGGAPEAALAGALFMLSPIHLMFRFNSFDNVAPLLPVLLAVSECALRGSSPRRSGAAWSLLATLMLLGGHGETAVDALALASAYHLLRAASSGPPRERAARTGHAAMFLGTCTALAALGAAVALWGQLEMIREWTATDVRSFFRYRRLPLAHLPAFLVPQRFAVPMGVYLGTLTLILAAGGAMGRGGPFPAWPWLVIGLGALLAAYGVWPVAPILEALPLLRVANHSWLVWVVHLVLAILAARGLQRLASPTTRRAMAVAVLLDALALGLLASTGFPHLLTGWALPELGLLRRPLVCLALAGIIIIAGPRLAARRAGAWLVASVVLAEVYTAWAPAPRPWGASFPPAPAILSLADGPPQDARSYVPDELIPLNASMVYGLPVIGAYDPTVPRRSLRLLQLAGLRSFRDHGPSPPLDLRPEALRVLTLLNVRHIFLSRPLENPALRARLEEVTRAPVALYRNPAALPRAFVVEEARIAATPEEALALVKDGRVDLAREVVLEKPTPAGGATPRRGGDGGPLRARMLEYHPGRARIAAETGRGGYLVFSETFAPGWHATVDGDPASVLPGDYALTTVPLPPGRHEVTLTYRPRSVVVGGVITLVTTLVLLVALLPVRLTTARQAP